jgi:hypothetical protein
VNLSYGAGIYVIHDIDPYEEEQPPNGVILAQSFCYTVPVSYIFRQADSRGQDIQVVDPSGDITILRKRKIKEVRRPICFSATEADQLFRPMLRPAATMHVTGDEALQCNTQPRSASIPVLSVSVSTYRCCQLVSTLLRIYSFHRFHKQYICQHITHRGKLQDSNCKLAVKLGHIYHNHTIAK